MPVIVYNMQENVCSPVCQLKHKINKQDSIYYRQNIIRLILIQNAGNVHNCTYMS